MDSTSINRDILGLKIGLKTGSYFIGKIPFYPIFNVETVETTHGFLLVRTDNVFMLL